MDVKTGRREAAEGREGRERERAYEEKAWDDRPLLPQLVGHEAHG